MNGRRHPRTAGARHGAAPAPARSAAPARAGAAPNRAGAPPGRAPRWLLAAGLATAVATAAWHTPPFTTTGTQAVAEAGGEGAGRGEREHRAAAAPEGRPPGPVAPAVARPPGAGGAPGRAAGSGGAGVGHAAWPVAGGARGRPVVERGFEPPRSPYGPGHRGVDLRAAAGQPVRAAAAGRVSFAGGVAGRGVVAVDHPGTGRPPLRTTYEPVLPAVRKGARVGAGQIVGQLQGGAYHCAAPCLHWGLRRGTDYLDPLSLLPPRLLTGGRHRLLPVFGRPPPGGS